MQNGEAKLGPPIIMCSRAYPECSAYGEGCGADGECDMDSSAENGNSSDSLDQRRQDRSVTTLSVAPYYGHLAVPRKERTMTPVREEVTLNFRVMFYLMV